MKKILVVEDQKSGHFILNDVITNNIGGVSKYIPCTMLSAYDGYEAIEKVKSERPDIVLMDINMPGLNGYETTNKIKKDPETNDTYIVALTAQALPEDRRKAMESGCNDFVTKPFDVLNLIHLLVDILKENNDKHQQN